MKYILAVLLLVKCVFCDGIWRHERAEPEAGRSITCFDCSWPEQDHCRLLTPNTSRCTNEHSCYKSVESDIEGRTIGIVRGCFALSGGHQNCRFEIRNKTINQCYSCSDRHYCNGLRRINVGNGLIFHMVAITITLLLC